MEETQRILIAYTDGSCIPNPGAGGWGWAITHPQEYAMACQGSSYQSRTTNNRMELTAFIDLLKYLKDYQGKIVIYIDSTYVINGYKKLIETRRVFEVNRDLWEMLLDTALPAPELRWVKGHSNDPGNELVDSLAKSAAEWTR